MTFLSHDHVVCYETGMPTVIFLICIGTEQLLKLPKGFMLI
tara:strand:- start:22824 stop:22946 length:123 start_codon:yes stop_codon:yes gene_type:complete